MSQIAAAKLITAFKNNILFFCGSVTDKVLAESTGKYEDKNNNAITNNAKSEISQEQNQKKPAKLDDKFEKNFESNGKHHK